MTNCCINKLFYNTKEAGLGEIMLPRVHAQGIKQSVCPSVVVVIVVVVGSKNRQSSSSRSL